MIDWKNILIGVLISIIPAIVVAILTVRLSLRQFYSQKWWERKADSYSRIVRELRNLSYCIKELYAVEMGEKKLSDKRLKTLKKRHVLSFESLKITAAEGDFVISKEASQELGRLINNIEANYYNPNKDSWADYYAREYDFVEYCNVNIRKLAKNDLNVYGLCDRWGKLIEKIRSKRKETKCL